MLTRSTILLLTGGSDHCVQIDEINLSSVRVHLIVFQLLDPVRAMLKENRVADCVGTTVVLPNGMSICSIF